MDSTIIMKKKKKKLSLWKAMNLESLFTPKNKNHYSQIKANEKNPAMKEQLGLPITKYYWQCQTALKTLVLLPY